MGRVGEAMTPQQQIEKLKDDLYDLHSALECIQAQLYCNKPLRAMQVVTEAIAHSPMKGVREDITLSAMREASNGQTQD